MIHYRYIINDQLAGTGIIAAFDLQTTAVSYTHLDVYKRQEIDWVKPKEEDNQPELF